MKKETQPSTTASPWRIKRVGPSAEVHVREIDPKIQAQMPQPEARGALQMGTLELGINLIKRDLRKLLSRS